MSPLLVTYVCHSAVIFCSAVPTLFTCMYIAQCKYTYTHVHMGSPLFIFNIRLKTKTSCQSTKQIINQQKYASKKFVFRDLVISQNTVQWKGRKGWPEQFFTSTCHYYMFCWQKQNLIVLNSFLENDLNQNYSTSK